MAAPSTEALLAQWNLDPSLLFGIALLTGAYLYLVGPLRERHDLGPPVSGRQITAFVCADLILILALLSPLDALGDHDLFSAHMVQHLLLASVWPLLLLLAIPSWAVRWACRRPSLHGLRVLLTAPVMAILLFNLAIYVWHFPPFYDLTLQNEGVHILEHLTFMAVGLINFWPVLSPVPDQRLPYPGQVLYLFADGMLMMVLSIVFTFTPMVLYTPYLASPVLWGISHLTDQQLGGLIMWYPGNLPYFILLCIAFYRWFDGAESRPIASERSVHQQSTMRPPVARP